MYMHMYFTYTQVIVTNERETYIYELIYLQFPSSITYIQVIATNDRNKLR